MRVFESLRKSALVVGDAGVGTLGSVRAGCGGTGDGLMGSLDAGTLGSDAGVGVEILAVAGRD